MAYTAIDDPEAYFQTKIYTGTGSSAARTFDGDTDMQPDMVWIKQRSGTEQHVIFDAVRGVQKYVTPNTNAAEGDTATTLTAFGSDGFTEGGHGITGQSSNTYVAWCWKESATSGFDIVSWTGDGSAQDISHSLSKVPTFIMVKNRDQADSWYCYNVHNGNTHSMILDTTSAKVGAYTDNWNDTTPTSSVFSVGGSHSTSGGSGEDMIAYVFTDIQGFSKFGVYTGNNNNDGNFIYTGFRPAFVLSKDTASTQSWHLIDSKRDTGNDGDNAALLPNASDSEANAKTNRGQMKTDLLSNGFKLNADSSHTNGTGTHIYMAFAEAPLVNSNGVPCNAR